MRMSINAAIKARRESIGMSQDELAAKVGYISRSSIAKIESMENDIPCGKIDAFAKALRISTPEILQMAYSHGENKTLCSDSKVIQMAQQIQKRQHLRALFDIAAALSEDEVKAITQMVYVLKKK